MVETLGQQGHQAVFADLAPDSTLPGGMQGIQADLATTGGAEQFYRRARQIIGVPDVLVCNAGRGVHSLLAEGDPDDWEYIYRLNVFGTLRIIRAFLPEMLERGQGDIIIISSVSAQHPYPGGAVYASSKAALEVIAETLRLEVQPRLRVATIVPGVVDTNFFKANIGGEQTPESIGWGALSPQEVAKAVDYLLQRPAGTAINRLVIRPVAQPM